MIEQLSLVVLVVALATGLLASIAAVTYLRLCQPEFFRYFLTNILLFNLLILFGLVLRYLQFQFQSAELRPYQFVVPGLLMVMAATLIFLGYLSVIAAASFVRLDTLGQAVNIMLETLIIGGALFVTIQLMFTAAKLPRDDRRKSVSVFGGYHLGLLATILAVLVVGWLQRGPQRLAQLLANGGFLVLFNVFPLVWIRWFRPLQPVSSLEKYVLLGITRREREIIKLILAGKTNQEIADDLFISVSTVKDHNHNLFRKSGVRNRLELANLFR